MRFAKICSFIVVAALVAVLFAGLSTPVAAMTWNGATLDDQYRVSSSMAVDSTGAPKICYQVADGLKYTEWIEVTSTTPGHWSSPVYIDHTAGVGAYCAIALYPNGDPAVVYFDAVNHALKFAFRNAQGVWGGGTLDDGSGGAYTVGWYCSIAIGTDSREQICYWDYSNKALKFAEWIFGEPDGHWDIRTIASGDVQGGCSIALDSNNNPEISYTGSHAGGGLGDLRCIMRVGGSWRPPELVDGSGSVGGSTSIADNQATRSTSSISYVSSGTLKYAERNPTTGTWSTTTPDAASSHMTWSLTSLAFDKNKQPAISYESLGSAGNHVLKFAYRDFGGWHTQTVDDGGSTHASVGVSTSLAIGSGNIPSISYYAELSLKCVEGHATSTAMTCTASASSVVLNQAFTVRGKLTSNGAALSKEAVHLERRTQKSGVWGAWVNVAGTTRITNATGGVSSALKLSTAGTYQYRWHYTGSIAYLAKYSLPVTVTVKRPTTATTLSASTTTPAVGKSVTFTATLKSGTTPLSGKSVTIYHYLNGAKYTDITTKTNANGQITLTQTFGSKGVRTYYAKFAGDSTYPASTSRVVTINVGKTTTTLTASDTTPAVKQQVTFTATLKSGTTPLASQSVTIYHYVNGVRYTDVTKTTNAAGQITFAQTFSSKGVRTYYATYAGVTRYMGSTSSVLTITVH